MSETAVYRQLGAFPCLCSIMGMPGAVRYRLRRMQEVAFRFGRREIQPCPLWPRAGEFKTICIPPCANIISFQRGMLMPYMVPDEALQHGYADVDDCRPIAKDGYSGDEPW